MNRNDLNEAMKKIDSDLVKEAKPKKSVKKVWIGLGVSAACIFLTASIIATSALVNVFKKPKNNTEVVNGGNNGSSVLPGPTGSDPEKSGYIDGYLKGKGSDSPGDFESAEGVIPVPEADYGYAKSSDSSYFGYGSDVGYPTIVDYPEPVDVNSNLTAGTLTAAEWKDIANLSDWYKLIQDNNWYQHAADRNLYTNKAVTVIVKDGEAPCFNVKVELKEGNNVISKGVTDINGRVCLFYNLNNQKSVPDKVSVNGNDYSLDSDTVTVDAKDAGIALEKIDLMFMIDTTGSMGDELRYIEAELVDMISRISEKDQSVSIRVSVNFYRDEYDDYIVKYYDFRTDINECLDQLSKETAWGGGDFPEAVHTALENAVTGHQWRNDALKLCFFVLDAPPHSEEEIKGINENICSSLVKAAEEGIRIIPLLCTGADQSTEYLLRSFALITNGTFVFTTRHSGIGYGHADPTVSGEYEVETLNECLIRIVCEFAGFEYEKPVTDNGQQQKDAQ